MRKSRYLFQTIGICAILLFSFSPAGKIDLIFKLKSGKVYQQTTSIVSITTQKIMGQEQVINSTTAATTTIELKSDDTEPATYSIAYENINMAIESAQQGTGDSGLRQIFNSDTAALDSPNEVSTLLSELTGRHFDATISKNGRVMEVIGLEEIIAEATSTAAGQAAVMGEQLSNGFGDTGLARNIEMFTGVFPEGPVKKGDTWSKEEFTASGLPLLAKNTYTLESVDAKKAVISVKGKLTTDPDNATAEMQNLEVVYFVEGTHSGSIEVEVETGWVLSATFTDEVNGSLNIAANTQMPDGMIIPLSMQSKTTIQSKP